MARSMSAAKSIPTAPGKILIFMQPTPGLSLDTDKGVGSAIGRFPEIGCDCGDRQGHLLCPAKSLRTQRKTVVSYL